MANYRAQLGSTQALTACPSCGPGVVYVEMDADVSQSYNSEFIACNSGLPQISQIWIVCQPGVPCTPGDQSLPSPGDFVYSTSSGGSWTYGSGYFYVSEPGTDDDAFIQVNNGGEVLSSGVCTFNP